MAGSKGGVEDRPDEKSMPDWGGEKGYVASGANADARGPVLGAFWGWMKKRFKQFKDGGSYQAS